MDDVGPDHTLGPVSLQCRQDVIHFLSLLFPAQTFKVAVVQHKWVVYRHAGEMMAENM